MADKLTILTSLGPRMSKLWKTDGSIEPYDNAKNFTVRQQVVDDIFALSTLLTSLETQSKSSIIRGAPKDNVDLQHMRRLIENVDDVPLHTILIEVDTFRPLVNDPVLEPEDAALEFIAECLPAEFRNVSFHWQLSNSAGAPGREGLFKAHLWFWLDTPYDSATLRAWAKSLDLPIDKSVLNPVQVHYIAAPVLENGVTCPVVQRSGLYPGAVDEVDFKINTDALQIKAQGERQRGERREIEDSAADWIESHWEVLGELPNGGLIVSCPFEAGHFAKRGEGDTSTVYFPAGTNGYPEGAWVCLHDTCKDRGRSEFLKQAGYMEDRLAGLAARPVTQINGHVLNDPLVLPPLRRTLHGQIITSLDNIVAALDHPMAVVELKYDGFKDGVVCAPWGSGTWRPFTDPDYTEMRIALEKRGFQAIGKEMIRDAVHLAAQNNAFDTAKTWIESLDWDGIPRVDSFWIEHFGVRNDPRGYALSVGRYVWSALAGRVMIPGIQADMVPILTGHQGLGKSRGVAAMSPARDFATTMSFHEPEVERARKMRGKMIVELAELQGLKSREREEILAWVTRSDEHWTPKFMEMSTTFRRRFIMFGTCNTRDFLDDPTGERRWLPLDCGMADGFTMVDTAAIAHVRDQLWAEGRDLFMKHGVAWEEAESLARGEHEHYKAEDVWSHAIIRWLDAPDLGGETPRQRTWLTIHDVAEGALSLAARNVQFHHQRRIAKILRDEGYDLITRRVAGKVQKVWAPVGFV